MTFQQLHAIILKFKFGFSGRNATVLEVEVFFRIALEEIIVNAVCSDTFSGSKDTRATPRLSSLGTY